MIDNLEGLLVFTKVVEKKSFTAAAQELRMSSPTVSKQVSRLEKSLGLRLLNRSTHQVSLTDYGATLYHRCSRLFAEIEDAQTSIRALKRGLTGTLRIHATPRVGERLVAPALVEFMGEHANLSVELTMRPELINPIEDGFDIAIRSGTTTDSGLKQSSLNYREFGPIRYLICAAPAYLARCGTPSQPRDLRAHNCLIHVTQSSARDWHFLGPEGEYAVEVSGSLVSNNHDMVHEAALAGLGIARFLEYEVADNIANGSLQVLFPDLTKTDRLIRAFYPNAAPFPQKVHDFLEFLDQRLVWDHAADGTPRASTGRE